MKTRINSTRALAEFTSTLDFDNLTNQVVTAAKRAVLDTLGAAVFGTTTEWAKLGRRYVDRYGSLGQSTAIASSETVSARDAALLNGLYAHGFELDDTHVPSTSHPGCVIVPAALAVIPDCESSGSRFLTAVVAGYEAMARIGAAVAPDHMSRGFHVTATVGTFGAATAACRMMGLREDQTLAALGIAGSFCSGVAEFANDSWGDMTKRLHAGQAAANGVIAAQLAASGYRGPRSILEGKQGFLNCFSRSSNPAKLTRGLGRTYEIERHISIKPYACCSNLFTVIEALKFLMARAGLNAGAVHRITVYTNRDSTQYHAQSRGIASIGAAQYSIPYAAAATLIGVIDDPLTAFSEAALRNPEIVRLCRKVATRLDRRVDALFPKFEAARVVVETRNGQHLEKLVKAPLGSPTRPLTSDQVADKFDRLCRAVLPVQAIQRIRQQVSALDSGADTDDLLRLLRGGSDVEGIQQIREHRVVADRGGERDKTATTESDGKRVEIPGVHAV